MVEKTEFNPSDMWSQFYGPMKQFGNKVAEFFSPSSEASFTDDYYDIAIEIPGVEEDQINIEVHDNRLTVSGDKQSSHEEKGKNFYFSERTFGSFRRTFRLPPDADEDKIFATHKDGVLEIKVAKLESRMPKPKKIEIGRG